MRGSLVPSALRYVDQVARSGSIQRAAKELNIAASAINRHILLLEHELGVALFERVARGMRLTSAGDALVTLARRWRSDERRVAAELKLLQGVNQGNVRLAAMDSHVNGFLPRVIAKLAGEHPSISLDVQIASTDDAIAALLGGSADLAAIFNLSPHRDIRVLWKGDSRSDAWLRPAMILQERRPSACRKSPPIRSPCRARSCRSDDISTPGMAGCSPTARK
jgi:DNA-binding transcriptional LysR family regulator